MNLKIDKLGEIVIAEIPAEHLDASNCEELEQALTELIGKEDQIILDMRNVGFIDSSGVGVLLFCIRTVDEKEGKICICNPTETVSMAFELVRIHRLCSVTNSRDEALRRFN